MKYQLIIRLYLGFVLMLVSLPATLAQGQLRIEVDLLSVEWYGIFDDQCCFDHFRPDPAWDITIAPRFYQDGTWTTLHEFSWCNKLVNQQPYGSPYGDANNTFSHEWTIYPPPFADFNTIENYRVWQGNVDVTGSGFDLCNNSIDLRYWTIFYENDASGTCDTTGGDYKVSSLGFRFDLSNRTPTPGVWHTERRHTARGSYGYYYTFRYRYTFDAIKEAITYRNTSNGAQSIFCEGDMYRIAVDYEDPQYSGGVFEWQSKSEGGPWIPEPGTGNFIDRPVTLPLRDYQVRMKPNSGCIYDNQDWISTTAIPSPTIVPAPPPSASINTTLNHDCPGNPLSITLSSISGYSGTTPFKVTLVNGAGNTVGNIPSYTNNQGAHTFPNMAPGSYTIKVSSIANNVNGETIANCTTVKPLGTLAHYPDVEWSGPIVTQPQCIGGSGSISLTITNGNGPQFDLYDNLGNWYDPSRFGSTVNYTVDPPFASYYYVTGSNSFGCFKNTGPISFSDPLPIAADVSVSVPIKCAGETGRVLFSNISGGTGPYNISWRASGSNGAWTTVATDVSAVPAPVLDFQDGAYEFRLVDANGCENVVGSATLDEPAVALAISALSTAASACRDDGSIAAGASGGEGPFTFSIAGEDDNMSGSFTGLATGSYTVSVVDSRGCERSTSVMVGKDAVLGLTISEQTDVTCPGDGDGSIVVSASGGSGGYTYSKNGINFQNSPLFENLDAGPITITLEDARGCTTTLDASIDEPETFLLPGFNVQPILCVGGLATVTINVTGRKVADNPLMVSTNGGTDYMPVELTLSGDELLSVYLELMLAPGNYDIRVKDQNDCSASGTITFAVTDATQVTAVLDSTNNISCFGADDGKIHINMGGGTSPYTVALVDADDDSPVQSQSNIPLGSFSITNVPPHDNYKVVVTDANGCMVEITSIAITTPDILQFSLQNTGPDIDCSLTNGEITVSAMGGTPPYQYSLDNSTYGSSATLSGATTSNTVYVRDANGCVMQQTIGIPAVPFDPNPMITVIDPAIDQCQGATIQVDFTSNGFSHTWKISAPGVDCDVALATKTTGPAESSFEISDLAPGSYQICAVAENCSMAPIPFDIVALAALKLEITDTAHVLCFGESTGSVSLVVTGGVGPYTITRNSADPQVGTTATYSALPAGTSFYQVIDSKGCTVGVSQNITQPNLIFYDQEVLQDALCADSTSGSISFRPIGGNGAYSVSWRPVGGDYVPIAMSGAMVVLSDIGAGTYQFSIADDNNCEKEYSFSISEPPALNLILSDTAHVSCNGANDGSVFATGSGGTGDLTYSIDGLSFSTDPDFQGLSPGMQMIYLRDDNACEITREFNIEEPAVLEATAVVTDVQCFSANDGRIVVTAIGGTLPYRYALGEAPTQTSNVFTGLQPDNYSVIVYDANNCSVSVNGLMITEPEILTISTTALTEATCQNGGSAMVSYGGGTAPYMVAWDMNTGMNMDTAVDLAGGLHTVIITDAQGCMIQDTVEVSTLGVPIIDVIRVGSPDCDDDNGVIAIQVRGSTLSPFTFTIDGDTVPNGNFANLAAGAYRIGVSDTLGCTSERTIVVSPPETPSLEVVSSVPEACGQNDGEVTFSPVGGEGPYQLEMNGIPISGMTLMGLAYGPHSVTIRDGKNCTSDFTFDVDSVGKPTAVIASLGEVCDRGNGQISVTPTSGFAPFSFEWSHDTISTSVAENLQAGNYKVSVTNSRGCVSVFASTVRDIKGPSIQLQELLPATCGNNNGLIKVSAQNAGAGFNLKWSHSASNSFTQENLAPGTYFLTLTNTNACQDTMSFVVEDQLFPPVEITVADQSCGGADGSIVLVPEGTGPYAFSWSHDSTLVGGTATNLMEGNYSISISDTSGCSIQIDTIIALNNTLFASVDTVVNSQCGAADGSIALEVTGDDITYLWSHDSTLNGPTASSLLAGEYSVRINNGTSCMVELDVTVTDEGTAELTLVSVDSATCGLLNGGASVDLSGGASPVTVSWYHMDDPTLVLQQGNTLNEVSGGEYRVVAEDANGCMNTLLVEIPFFGDLATSVEKTSPSCPGRGDGTATVTVMGDQENLTYLWNDDNAQTTSTATNLKAGSYMVLVSSGNDCEVMVEVEIEEPIAHGVNLEILAQPSCNGLSDGQIGVTVVGDQGNLQYLWNGQETAPTTQFDNLAAGLYQLSVIDSLGCEVIDSIDLEGPDTLRLSLDFVNGASCSSLDGGNAQIQVSGGTGEYSVQWSDSAMQTSALALNLDAGPVVVFVTDANQCSDSLLVEVPTTSEEMAIERTLVKQPSCLGDEDGAIELQIPEGSGAFVFTWNDSITTTMSTLNDLSAGSYIFHAVDQVTGCAGSDTIVLVGPAAWSTALEVINEGCDSMGGDGSITATVTGGNGGYTYQWNDTQNQETATAVQLQGGTYIVTITDANGCQVLDTAEVKTAGELDIDLGGRQVVLCAGEQHYVELPDSAGITYQWSGPNGFTSTESSLYLPEAGSYWVDVDQAGCRSSDTVTVTSSAESLNALFVLPSQVVLGDTVVALEVSWPAPDATDWIFDSENIQHLPQSNNTHYFVFANTGTYDISLQSTVGTCIDFITKTVLVATDSSSFVFPIDFGTQEILELSLSPNPNNGIFSVSVKLNSVADVFVQINDALGVVEETRRDSGAQEYKLEFDLNLVPGLHAMTIQAKSSRKTLMFLVN